MGADLPEAIVGDAGRLRQIVLNLLSNAIKFTEQGEVVLSRRGDAGRRAAARRRGRSTSTSATPASASRPSAMDLLFQSFSQVDASISRRYGGTGLGLAISRRLAESMGGTPDGDEQRRPGRGQHCSASGCRPRRRPCRTRPPPAPERSLRGCRVLVVDDNATNRRILTSFLERWGVEWLATRRRRSRRSAGSAAVSSSTSAVLDFLMPERDGVELAEIAASLRPDAAASRSSSCRRSASTPGRRRTSRRCSSSRSSRPRCTMRWPTRWRARATDAARARRDPDRARRPRHKRGDRRRDRRVRPADPARRGQRREPEARPAAARADGLPGGRRRRRARGRRGARRRRRTTSS